MEEEPKRLSIKKGIPKPEEPVDEISQIKLSKAPIKPVEEKSEEPQVAQSKKPMKKVVLKLFNNNNTICLNYNYKLISL